MESTHSLPLERKQRQPWLSSPGFDLLFILSPALISSTFALLFGRRFEGMENLPLFAWVVLVLMVDVAHVYATLFRTYLDKEALAANKRLLLVIPLACQVVGVLLYSLDALYFWRALAYLAVFHFVRQQYGFLALYGRGDAQVPTWARHLDQTCIYTVTLYPILYWHAHAPRHFNWFVEGDFFSASALASAILPLAGVFYILVAIAYFIKECLLFKNNGFVNLPRNLLMLGTALSWYVGIVATNSDLIFTMTNVLSHGIPYMALIWLYRKGGGAGGADAGAAGSGVLQVLVSFAPAFFAFLVFLAYLEEGFWDGFVWREHLTFFAPFAGLPVISDPAFLAVLVPLLSLPQSTHYVLDGYIWRVKDRNSQWSA